MKKTKQIIILVIITALLFTTAAYAQTEDPALKIRVSKNFGYSGFGNDIQGTFTIHVTGPDDLAEVHFYLDDTLIGTDAEPKYALQFKTDDYEPGLHQIHAVGILADGTELRTTELTRDFISGERSMDIAIWIVGIILAISLIGVVGQVLFGPGKADFKLGKYGAGGGTVCSRCGFPFARPLLSPNLGLGKLTRCPHCGKLGIKARASAATLAAAEQRYRDAQHENGTLEVDQDDSLRRSLEDSRFDD